MTALKVSLGMDAAGFISGVRNATEASDKLAVAADKAFRAAKNSQNGMTEAAANARAQTLRNLGATEQQVQAFLETAASLRAYKQELKLLGDTYAGNKAGLGAHMAALAQQKGLLSFAQIEVRELAAAEEAAAAKARQMEQANHRLNGSIKNLLTGSVGLVAAFASFGKLAAIQDEWTGLNNRLKLVTSSAAQLRQVQEALLQSANATGQSVTATAQIYQRLATSKQNLRVTDQQLLQITDTVNKSVALSGASASAAEAAMIQFGQAIASGTLRGDELNSILEQSPYLAQTLAKGMGVSVGQLRSLGRQGKLTTEQLAQAILKMKDSVDGDFGKMNLSISQSFTVLQNNLGAFVNGTGEATGAAKLLSGAIGLLARHIDLLAYAVTAFAAVKLAGYLKTLAVEAVVLIARNVVLAASLRSVGVSALLSSSGLTTFSAANTAATASVTTFSGALGILRTTAISAWAALAPIAVPLAAVAAAAIGTAAAVQALYNTANGKGGQNFLNDWVHSALDALGILDKETESLGTKLYDFIHQDWNARKVLELGFKLSPAGRATTWLVDLFKGKTPAQIKADAEAKQREENSKPLSQKGSELQDSIARMSAEMTKAADNYGKTAEQIKLLEMQTALEALRKEEGSRAAVAAAEADIAKAQAAVRQVAAMKQREEKERAKAAVEEKNRAFIASTLEELQKQAAELGKSQAELTDMRLAAAGASEMQRTLARETQGVIDQYRRQQEVMQTLDSLRYQAATAGMSDKDRQLYDLQQKGATAEQLALARSLIEERERRENAARWQEQTASRQEQAAASGLAAAQRNSSSAQRMEHAGYAMQRAAEGMKSARGRQRRRFELPGEEDGDSYEKNRRAVYIAAAHGSHADAVTPAKAYTLRLESGNRNLEGKFVMRDEVPQMIEGFFNQTARAVAN